MDEDLRTAIRARVWSAGGGKQQEDMAITAMDHLEETPSLKSPVRLLSEIIPGISREWSIDQIKAWHLEWKSAPRLHKDFLASYRGWGGQVFGPTASPEGDENRLPPQGRVVRPSGAPIRISTEITRGCAGGRVFVRATPPAPPTTRQRITRAITNWTREVRRRIGETIEIWRG